MDSFGVGASLHPAGYGVLPAGASAVGSAATAGRFASAVGTTAPSLPAPPGSIPGSYVPGTGSQEFTFVPAPSSPATPARSLTSSGTTPMALPPANPTGDSTPGVVMPTGDSVQGRVVTTGDQSGTVQVTGDMIGAPRMVMPMGDQRGITNATGDMNSPMVFPMADANIVPKLPGGACPPGSSLQQNVWGGSDEFVCVAPTPPMPRPPAESCPPGSSYQSVPDSREFACVPDHPLEMPKPAAPPVPTHPVVMPTGDSTPARPGTGDQTSTRAMPPGACPPGSSYQAVPDSREFACVPDHPLEMPKAPNACPPGSSYQAVPDSREFACVSDTAPTMPTKTMPTGDQSLGKPTGDMTPNMTGPTHSVGDFTPGSTGTGDRLGTPQTTPQGPWVMGPTPVTIGMAGTCFPQPVRGNGQVIVNDRFRAPPGCVRIPSYGSYPAVSPWLAIPDGSPQTQTGWNNLPIVLGAGAASAPDDLLSQAGKLVMFGLGAYVGYKAVKRNFR